MEKRTIDIDTILKLCDHTILRQTTTWNDIKNVCDEGIKYRTASVCIPPCFVKRAKEYVNGELKICTVVGFPNGYNTTELKVFEAEEAIRNGADEVDMVINIGMLKSGETEYVLQEIKKVKAVCGNKILKVIVETCLLTDEEKIKACEIVTKSGADYIKTSTGFSCGGATREDIKLFSEHIGDGVKIKAAGGISNIRDAEDFILLGANRLGTSKIVKLIKTEGVEKNGNTYTSY